MWLETNNASNLCDPLIVWIFALLHEECFINFLCARVLNKALGFRLHNDNVLQLSLVISAS